MMNWKINGTFMFRLDAVDLATGASTLDEIVKRNKGKVFNAAIGNLQVGQITGTAPAWIMQLALKLGF